MNRDISFKILRVAWYLMLKIKSRPDKDAHSAGRDLYDIVFMHTTDTDLRYQMSECHSQGWDRVQSLRYLNHRLNIGFF